MKVAKIVLIIVLVLVVLLGALAWYVIGNMQKDAVPTVAAPNTLVDELDNTPTVLTIEATATATPEPAEVASTPMPIYETDVKDAAIYNILLVGTDSRHSLADNPDGRSDTMILASFNTGTKEIKLVSFMRDARVRRIGTKGTFSFYNRLNSAYSGGYAGGGVGELINTINYNFGLDIQNYVCVGFDGFAALVDKIGGIDVELDQKEINFINDRISGEHEFEPEIVKKAKRVSASPGLVHLDGAQALIFARNRSTGEGGSGGDDFTRVGRQQEVLKIIFNKVTSEMNVNSAIGLISFATSNVATNMDVDTMTKLITAMFSGGITFDTTHVPFEGTYKNWIQVDKEKNTSTKTDLLDFDLKDTQKMLSEYLYGPDGTPVPESTDDAAA